MATNEQIRDALSQKITSHDQWVEICRGLGLHTGNFNPDRVDSSNVYEIVHRTTGDGFRYTSLPKDLWFVYREMHRRTYVYAPVDGWDFFTVSPWSNYLPHISKVDPTQVAFFPDRAALENDRPMRTTIGRFLVKANPLVSMTYVQKIEAEWRAAADPTLEIIPPHGIAEAYRQLPSGVGACMSHDAGRYDAKGHHPAEVFNAPGFGMAVTRRPDGKVAARSLVWVNPDDENDKRFLRCYGDSRMLRRKLQVNGYRAASLHGAKLKRIDLGTPQGNYVDVVMPYLDGIDDVWGRGGTAQDGASKPCPRVYAVTDDNQWLHVTTTASSVGGCALSSPTSTSGRIHIPIINPAGLRGVCAVSGRPWVSDMDEVVKVGVIQPDGTIREGRALKSEASHLTTERVMTDTDGDLVTTWKLLVGDQGLLKECEARGLGRVLLTSDVHARLLEARDGESWYFYLDGGTSLARGCDVVKTVSGERRLAKDCTRVISRVSEDNGCHYTPNPNDVAELRRRLKLVTLHGHTAEERAVLGDRGHPSVVRTMSGSWALKHDAELSSDGEWFLSRTAARELNLAHRIVLVSEKTRDEFRALVPSYVNSAPKELDASYAQQLAQARAYAAVILQRITGISEKEDRTLVARRLHSDLYRAAHQAFGFSPRGYTTLGIPASEVTANAPVFRASIDAAAEMALLRHDAEVMRSYRYNSASGRPEMEEAKRQGKQRALLATHLWMLVGELMEALLDADVYKPEPEPQPTEAEPAEAVPF